MDTARALALLAAAASGIGLGACERHDQPTGPASGSAVLEGNVNLAKTGAGVPNLIVALVRDGAVLRATPTDAEGRFSFDRLPAGAYGVRLTGLELTGLGVHHTALEPPQQEVVLADGAPAEAVFAAVGLVPPRVAGFVECDGVPVPGVAVRVVGGDTDVVVETNAQGRYGATDLSPGNYTVILPDPPCAAGPPYRVISLLPGQSGVADFGG